MDKLSFLYKVGSLEQGGRFQGEIWKAGICKPVGKKFGI